MQNRENEEVKLPPMFKSLEGKLELEFDYEINSIKVEDSEGLDCKMYYYDNKTLTYSKLLIILRNCELQHILGQPQYRVPSGGG